MWGEFARYVEHQYIDFDHEEKAQAFYETEEYRTADDLLERSMEGLTGVEFPTQKSKRQFHELFAIADEDDKKTFMYNTVVKAFSVSEKAGVVGTKVLACLNDPSTTSTVNLLSLFTSAVVEINKNSGLRITHPWNFIRMAAIEGEMVDGDDALFQTGEQVRVLYKKFWGKQTICPPSTRKTRTVKRTSSSTILPSGMEGDLHKSLKRAADEIMEREFPAFKKRIVDAALARVASNLTGVSSSGVSSVPCSPISETSE